ncbi:ATP-binding protein [Bifidobacterium boum]|uniref:ATP-binding protein n=1 Tax=Bifidobacterium boum TaxID=78343 RepID=UPI003F903844
MRLSLPPKKRAYISTERALVSRPKDTDRHICAFADAAGGKLVIGIEDHGKITGFKGDRAHNIEEFEQIALVGCDPVPEVHPVRIPVINEHGKSDNILLLEIAPFIRTCYLQTKQQSEGQQRRARPRPSAGT